MPLPVSKGELSALAVKQLIVELREIGSSGKLRSLKFGQRMQVETVYRQAEVVDQGYRRECR